MNERRLIRALALGGVLVYAMAPLVPAAQLDPPKTPGAEYVFELDYNETPYDPNDIMVIPEDPNTWGREPNDANNVLNVMADLGHGSWLVLFVPGEPLVAVSRLSGWVSLNLGDPAPGSPRNWDVHCHLGRAGATNIDDILYDFSLVVYGIEAYGTRFLDFDVWYQDPNDILARIDPNWWLDPGDAPTSPGDFDDPNSMGDPNSPTFNDPEDANYGRSVDLTGGTPISSGILNSESQYFWHFVIKNQSGGIIEEETELDWSGAFAPWHVQVADANYLHPNSTVPGDVQCEIDWILGIGGDVSARGICHFEGAAYTPPTPWTLTIKKKDCTDMTIDPCLPAYQDDRLVVLSSVVPVGNKVFKKWTIKGPNQSDDPLYQVRVEMDPVLYHVMDGDYLIKATCKCGGGGLEPFAGMVLLVLGLGVLIRRLT